MIRKTSSIIALLIPLMMSAQNTGTLRLLVDPGHNYEFVVDKKHRMQQREVKLTEGLHHFSFWAPERMVVDTNVFVVADRTSDLVMKLPLSAEFITYQRELNDYRASRRARTWAPVILAGGLAWTGFSYARYDRAGDELDQAVADYHSSDEPGVIGQLKTKTIPERNEALKKARTSVMVSSMFSVAALGLGSYIWVKTKGKEKPTFEDKERIRFEGLSWMPDNHGPYWLAGLSIPLAR